MVWLLRPGVAYYKKLALQLIVEMESHSPLALVCCESMSLTISTPDLANADGRETTNVYILRLIVII